jgi:hypothetical protein
VRVREWKVTVQRTLLVRIAALLLLLIAGAELYACDIADACTAASLRDSGQGCDDPGGDNCICCCHHVVPVTVVALEPGEIVLPEGPAEPVIQLLTASLPIDHPPQL